MLLFRKKCVNDNNTEYYVMLNSDVFNKPNNKCVILNYRKDIDDIPFLATHTYKIIESITIVPNYQPNDLNSILFCENSWTEIPEIEFNAMIDDLYQLKWLKP